MFDVRVDLSFVSDPEFSEDLVGHSTEPNSGSSHGLSSRMEDMVINGCQASFKD